MNWYEFWASIHEAIAEILGLDEFDIYDTDMDKLNHV